MAPACSRAATPRVGLKLVGIQGSLFSTRISGRFCLNHSCSNRDTGTRPRMRLNRLTVQGNEITLRPNLPTNNLHSANSYLWRTASSLEFGSSMVSGRNPNAAYIYRKEGHACL